LRAGSITSRRDRLLAQHKSGGVGAEWRLPDFTLEAIFWYNHGSLAKPGGSVAVRWAPTDHWTFSGEAEKFAADTPLRAVLNGITADLVGVGLEYAWHDRGRSPLARNGMTSPTTTTGKP
jgi:biofilm PGA synthesis protein PgaA